MICQDCNNQPALHAKLQHNVGMLFARRVYETHRRMCRRCLTKSFTHHQLRNLTLGWWGTISFFTTWYFLARNTVTYVRTRWRLSNEPGHDEARCDMDEDAEARLEAFDETVARRIEHDEPIDAIAADLADITGVSIERARAFVERQAAD